MLPIDPNTLEQYHPDQLKQDAKNYAVSELRAGADRLIETTPGAQQMKENAEFVNDNFLKGVPPLSLSQVKNLSLADAEEIAEVIMVNVANYYGIPITSLKVEDWVNQGLDYLKTQVEDYVADAAMEAMSQFGLQSVSNYASQVAPLVGLVTTTAEALEDGHLSQGEAMTISTTALTNASTIFAGSAVAAGLGVVGAVFAPAAIGTAYLESIIAAEEEQKRINWAAARQKASQEEAAINKWLLEAQQQLHAADKDVWKQKDHAVGSIATDWAALEGELKRSFQLRFFPGAPPPLRGGWYMAQARTNAPSYLRKVECQNLAGCLYFPGSDSFASISDFARFAKDMREAGFLLSKNSLIEFEYFAGSPYHFPQIADVYGGAEYAYYWRTLRAFDALVPMERDGAGRPVGFWAHPGHPKRQEGQKPLKDYGLLGWDVYCRKDPFCYQACPYNAPCSLDTMRRVGRSKIEQSYYSWKQYSTKPWDMAKEATDYVAELFERLQDESTAVATYQTRLRGDLFQTAGAVRGEQEIALRLVKLAQEVGYDPNKFSTLDASDKKSIMVLDEGTREALTKFENRSNTLNNVFLAAGGLTFAAGAGMWLAKGRPWPIR